MVAELNPAVEALAGPGGAMQNTPKELLRAEAISRRFGPVQALASADITLLQGEVHVLLGENGAGKSTLAKVLSGIYPDRRDRIWIDGQSVHLSSVQAARSFGIATVFQELSLIPALSVAENLGLVRSPIASPFRWLKSREDVEAAQQVVDRNRLRRFAASARCRSDPGRASNCRDRESDDSAASHPDHG